MDLLYAIRGLGMADPATDATSEETVRAALAREIDKATAAQRPGRPRRSRRRMRLTVPTLAMTAAAAAAVVVATGALGGSHASQNIGNGGSSVHAQDTAYIVKRVKAKIAADQTQNEVTQLYNYSSGQISSNGSLVNLGPGHLAGAGYTAPDGTSYYQVFGSLYEVTGPVVNGKQSWSLTQIDPGNRTYSQQSGPNYSSGEKGPAASLGSSSSQVQQALQSGEVTQVGTPTFNGTQAIALLLREPIPVKTASGRVESRDSEFGVLYVNPQTYQPLGQANFGAAQLGGNYDDGDNGPAIFTYVPATPVNIALAEDVSIPAGYTNVSAPSGG